MIKVGVTGSNGFIGWHLCHTLRLAPEKFEVIEFKREWFNETKKLDNFVLNCDVLIHLAGLNRHNDENEIFKINIGLAEKLIESFERTGFKGHVIFSSSIQEERNNTFGNSKKLAKNLLHSWAIKADANFKGLIIPNVFGAYGKPFYNSVISTFCHQLVIDDTPKIENDVTLNLIYIDDLIKVVIELMDKKTIENITVNYTDSLTVTKLLEVLISFRKKYFENGQIPYFANKFELNLFNTFRSYFDLNVHFPICHNNNIDERGNFVEIIRLGIGGQVSFSTTQKGVTRGNHFHTRKIERFSVIKGEALIQLRKIGSAKVYDYYLSGNKPAYVDMPIWCTHNIKNIGEEELFTMFWINEFYDAEDPDTYFEVV